MICTLSRLKLAAGAAAAAVLLSACAGDQSPADAPAADREASETEQPLFQGRPPAATAAPKKTLSDLADPLLDAPYQTLVQCDSEEPLASGDKFADARLLCHDMRVAATVTEFRDAGWRIEALSMSEVKLPDGTVAIPFTVSLRKLF